MMRVSDALKFPIHPLLFGAGVIVACLDSAKKAVPPIDALPCLFLVEAAIVLYFLLLWAFGKDAKKAALACSVGIAATFSYRFCITLFEALLGTKNLWMLSLAIWAFVLLCWTLTCFKDSVDFGKLKIPINHAALANSLNILSAILLVINMAPLFSFFSNERQTTSELTDKVHSGFTNVAFKTDKDKPDVYYILLDAFCHSQSLKTFWNYDNSEFTKFLTDHGFYVVPHACSNYSETEISMSTELNMQYANTMLPDSMIVCSAGPNAHDYIYDRLIQNNSVMYLLHRLGYKYINLSSVSPGFFYIPEADRNLSDLTIDDFTVKVLMLTPLISIEHQFPILRDIYNRGRLTAERTLPAALGIPGPKFVFMHVLLPHPPFLLSDKGPVGNLTPDGDHNYESSNGYLDQVKAAQQLARKLITEIEAKDPNAVIVMQGDHGPWFQANQPLPIAASEKLRILNAVRFPSVKNAGLYEDLTPVNTFRVFFNQYFGANLPILPPHNYLFSRKPGEADKLIDATSVMKFDP